MWLGSLTLAATFSAGCGPGDPAGTGGSGGSGGSGATGGSGGTGATGATGGSGGTGATGGSGGAGGTGTGGTGTGGGPTEWTAPACQSVTGTSAVTFTLDEGATLAPTPGQLSGIGYTWGLAALDTPNTLLAEHQGHLLRSEDAGCSWTEIATLAGGIFKLTAAPGGRAYAWVDNGAAFYRIDGDGVHPLDTPADNIVGLGVAPGDGLHVRIGDANGNLHDSDDGGATWSKQGTSPAQGGNFIAYRFAFDPADLDHVLFGQSVDGSSVSFDGGATWTKSAGLGSSANAFSLVVSPVDGDLVWAESLELGPDVRHLYRSTDGGATFDVVVTESAEVDLINGTLLAPHTADPDILYFVFGTGYADYGTDLYRYDHATGAVTKTHNDYDEVSSIVASPADPSVLYLGLTVENGG